jgi:hypothetical protein
MDSFFFYNPQDGGMGRGIQSGEWLLGHVGERGEIYSAGLLVCAFAV